MKHEYLEGNTEIHYPDTFIFTGGGNSYIMITKPRSGAECTLLAAADGMDVQIKRTAANGRDIIFPLSDILTALWEHARGKVDPMSIDINKRKLRLNIQINYDKRITNSLYFILINGSPDRDVTKDQDSDRRRGVFWGNDYESFELFTVVEDREIGHVSSSWSSQDIRSECYLSNPFLQVSTVNTGTPPNGNADIALAVEELLIQDPNFTAGGTYWSINGDINEDTVNRIGIVELDGKNWAYLNVSNERIWFQQSRSEVIKAGETYTLSFTARTAMPNKPTGVALRIFNDDTIIYRWECWDEFDAVPRQAKYKFSLNGFDNGNRFELTIGRSMYMASGLTTEAWITDVRLVEGDTDDPEWTPTYRPLEKMPLYIDVCPLSEQDMELNWFDEWGVFCNWRFTEEYNETAVTNDATLTRMAVSNNSLYQTRTRMARKQTTYTLHSRKVPRDVVPFIKSILSAPVVWRYNTDRRMEETMIIEDYKEKDYGRGYVDIVIKVTDTPQSYE